MSAVSAPSRTASPFDATAFERFVSSRREPAWVSDFRRRSFEAYRDLLVTELDPEEWKRIDTRAFRPEKFVIRASSLEQGVSSEVAAFGTLLADRAEFAGVVSHVDGACARSTLSEALAAKGVLFGNLNDFVQTHGDVLKPHLMTRAVTPEADRFAAWHGAFWTGGTVLYVPRNVEDTAPLYSLIGLQGDNVADLSHTLVILEDGATFRGSIHMDLGIPEDL